MLVNSFSSHSGRKQQLVSAIHHYLVYAHLIICICEVIKLLLNYCYQIYKNLPMVCTLIQLRNGVKWSTLKWNHKLRARESVWFSVISMVDKSIDHGKLLSICFVFYLQWDGQFLTSISVEVSLNLRELQTISPRDSSENRWLYWSFPNTL